MNRLSPLIVRSQRAPRVAGSISASRPRFDPFGDPPPTPGEWRLFLTSFAAGLVFFGTFVA